MLSGLGANALAEATKPLLLPYPYASLIAQDQEEAAPRDFVLSAVEKNRREVSIEQQVRTDAAISWQTYELPKDVDLADVEAHYLAQLQNLPTGKIVFACRGRDCGRSNTWANDIFNQATLYGRDQHQVYFAAATQQQLIWVYLIKRGNQRQYAHVAVLTPTQMPQLPTLQGAAWDTTFNQLVVRGVARLPDVTPQPDGQLTSNARATLQAFAKVLANRLQAGDLPASANPLLLACHLYPKQLADAAEVAQAVTRAQACADAALEIVNAELTQSLTGETTTVALAAFGVGPLAPVNPGGQASMVRHGDARIMLVAPNIVSR